MYQHKLADAPEWTIVTFEVGYPPDGSTPPHKHGGANVFAFVLEGEVLSAMNDEEPKVYKPGESWYVKLNASCLVNVQCLSTAQILRPPLSLTLVVRRIGSNHQAAAIE